MGIGTLSLSRSVKNLPYMKHLSTFYSPNSVFDLKTKIYKRKVFKAFRLSPTGGLSIGAQKYAPHTDIHVNI